MKFQDRHWSRWMAAAGNGRVGAGYWRESGDAPGEFTRQQIGHSAAIGKAGGKYPRWINAESRLEMV